MARPVKYQEPARLNLVIERMLHDRFKAACSLQHKKMTDVLIELMGKFADKTLSPQPSPTKKSKR